MRMSFVRRAALLVTILAEAALLVSCEARVVRPLYLASNSPQRAASDPLVIATDLPGERREVIVDAQLRRTSLGHFRRGDRVEIQAIAGKWTFARGAELVGANGLATSCVAPAPHVCAAGNDAAPGMGLMLYEQPDPEPARCAPTHRFAIPNGVEMELPETAHLFLAPNDLEDAMTDNTGLLRVQLDVSPNKTARIFHSQVFEVRANAPRTPLGAFGAGTYVRVTVSGGRWQHGPQTSQVGPEGDATTKCASDGVHRCTAGEGAPRMGLVFLMASCADGGVPTPTGEERKTFIGAGRSVTVLTADAELQVGPNDWEDGCEDNAGALTIELLTKRANL